MSANRRFAADVVSPVAHESARTFLEEVGLPIDHLLFAASDPSVRGVDAGGSESQFLKVGDGGDYEEFCIGCISGEVVVINTLDSTIWHVNRSPQLFLECLEEFERGLPYGREDITWPEMACVVDLLKQALLAIDPTVQVEKSGFWYDILHDVAVGDYVED